MIGELDTRLYSLRVVIIILYDALNGSAVWNLTQGTPLHSLPLLPIPAVS
jgi:hypothetical protein